MKKLLLYEENDHQLDILKEKYIFLENNRKNFFYYNFINYIFK